jgi:TruD family tRNA pseudouridine synthase
MQKVGHTEHQPTLVENDVYLSRFGIYIPGKEHHVPAHIKLKTEDFIVQEIDIHGNIAPLESTAVSGSFVDSRFIIATLVKRGLGTLEALEIISAQIGCNTKNISYYGLKDQDGITSQYICFNEVAYEKIQAFTHTQISLIDIRPGTTSFRIGELKGNRFTITLRFGDQKPNIDLCNSTVEQIRKEGFLNYYYVQRFGGPRLINYIWGYFIVQGKYEEAIKSILFDTNDNENIKIQELRKKAALLNNNWNQVASLFEVCSSYFFQEILLLNALLKYGNDYKKVFSAIPEQTKLWIYGFASLLFNELVKSYVESGKALPAKLPLITTDKESDFDTYNAFLTYLNIRSDDIKKLPFSFIQMKHREVATRENVEIEHIEINDNYAKLTFSLAKGSYATGFLSHLFNLVFGSPLPRTFDK